MLEHCCLECGESVEPEATHCEYRGIHELDTMDLNDLI